MVFLFQESVIELYERAVQVTLLTLVGDVRVFKFVYPLCAVAFPDVLYALMRKLYAVAAVSPVTL